MEEIRRDLLAPFAETGIGAGLPGVRVPAVDVMEEENQFVVTAEVPGFDKKDVKLEIEENGLVIRARKASAQERVAPEGGRRWLRRERSAQSLERFVALPDEVSPDGVRATFRNGILEVVVPKTAPEKRRRRSVEID